MVSHINTVYIIGGYCDDVLSSRVVEYPDGYWWMDLGNLQAVRGDHRAIANGDRFYVIGGYSESDQPADQYL